MAAGITSDGDRQFWTDLGERVCAPLYFSLCHWIRGKVAEDNLSRLLFLARDGHIMKQSWEALYGETGDVELTYFWISRRAACIASMDSFGKEEQASFFPERDLGLREQLHQLGWDLEPLEREAGDLDRLDLGHPAVTEFILGNARRERKDFLAYLESLGLLRRGGERIGIVDLGWHGSLQAALEKLLREAGSGTVLRGYYFGTIEPLAVADGSTATGLFLDRSLPEFNDRTIRHSRGLVEILFSAPHASVMRVVPTATGFQPQFAGAHENDGSLEAMALMQAAALEQLRSKRHEWTGMADEIRQSAFNQLARLLRHPTPREGRLLGNLAYFGGFGAAPRRQFLARPEGRAWDLARLRRQYRRANWRRGFLQRLPFWQRLLLRPLIIGMTFDRC